MEKMNQRGAEVILKRYHASGKYTKNGHAHKWQDKHSMIHPLIGHLDVDEYPFGKRVYLALPSRLALCHGMNTLYPN